MDEARMRDTGRLALAVGAVAAGSAACLVTFSVIGQPFGTINDLGNSTTAVLSGWLAWRLRGEVKAGPGPLRSAPRWSVPGSRSSARPSSSRAPRAGSLPGSSSLGAAGIGAWLIVANRSEGAATGGHARFDESGSSPGR